MRKDNRLRRFIVILLGLVLIFGIISWWNFNLSPVSRDQTTQDFVAKQEVHFIVRKGEGLSSVAERLQEQGLIRSPLVFKLYTRQTGLDSKIQAGTFKISSGMSAEEILQLLSGKPVERWVTLVEGLRIEEMARKLNEELGIKDEDFLRVAKEGYMFPDTYLLPQEITVEKIAQIIKDNFEQKFDDLLRQKIRQQGLTEEQGVILASIIEREARSDEARRMVASILLKRFKIGMKLDADATVQYAKDSLKLKQSGKIDKFWKPVTQKDYSEIASPYNTYLNAGLPPAPICNPSLSSLRAVANADSSVPYLYYYHDSRGKSHYASTLEEHNKNVANNP